MEAFNRTLFLWINAPAHPNALLLTLATVLAEYLFWLIPIGVAVSWLRGGEHTRKVLLEVTTAALVALLINQAIGLVWQHPRPFMIGLGHHFLAHAADSSFPSDHLTLMWAVAFSLMMHHRWRLTGVALALLALPVAWARIYLGVHFPLDMAGAVVVASLAAWLARRQVRWYLPPLYGIAMHMHRALLGRLIARGWMKE
jgi:undecaprenyl-diphosphatase